MLKKISGNVQNRLGLKITYQTMPQWYYPMLLSLGQHPVTSFILDFFLLTMYYVYYINGMISHYQRVHWTMICLICGLGLHPKVAMFNECPTDAFNSATIRPKLTCMGSSVAGARTAVDMDLTPGRISPFSEPPYCQWILLLVLHRGGEPET